MIGDCRERIYFQNLNCSKEVSADLHVNIPNCCQNALINLQDS